MAARILTILEILAIILFAVAAVMLGLLVRLVNANFCGEMDTSLTGQAICQVNGGWWIIYPVALLGLLLVVIIVLVVMRPTHRIRLLLLLVYMVGSLAIINLVTNWQQGQICAQAAEVGESISGCS